MIVFLLPHSKKQSKISLKDCSSKAPPPSIVSTKSDNRLLPLWRLLKGPFWESLDLPALPPPVRDFILDNSLVLSPVFGILSPKECVYIHPYSWQELKNISKKVKEIAKERLKGSRVFIFCSAFERSLIKEAQVSETIEFLFYKKQTPIKDPRRHLAYCLRYIAEYCPDLNSLERINFLDYKVDSIIKNGSKTKVILSSPGFYGI
ncbi:MAG: hypothetical protein ABDH18_00300 [Aquificaceae bacterium]